MKLNKHDIAALEAQLEAVGFTRSIVNGQEWWAQEDLGGGRTFMAALEWAVGSFVSPTQRREANERINEAMRIRINEAVRILTAPWPSSVTPGEPT